MTIQTITLDRLVPPKSNPRSQINADTLEGLAASIHTDGLLQNLVVRKKGRKFEIISGERRFRALSLLQERGDIKADFAVPVEVKGRVSADDALRLATVENIQREQLNPIDEAEAFARMVTDGAEFADIAAKAGVSEIIVKRRLALAALCSEVKAAIREGEVSLSVAEAMTLATQEQQKQIFEQIMAGYHYSAADIRDWLTEEKPNVAMAIFDIGRYSGTVTRDLFDAEETTFFDDAEQFLQFQQEAVKELAERHRQTGAWVEIVNEWHVPWWQYREADEGEASGVVIHMSPSGRVEVREGLMKKEMPESAAKSSDEALTKTKKAKPEYSGPLVRYIAARKTLAMQAALLDNPRKAKEVAVVQMMNGYDFGGSNVPLKPHAAWAIAANDEQKPKAYDLIEQIAQGFAEALDVPENDGAYTQPYRGAWERLTKVTKPTAALYEAVKQLSDADLDRLHLLLTTLCFGQGNIDGLDTDENSLFNMVAADLGVDMVNHWRPDNGFLSRRSKAQLEDVARESGAAFHLGRFADYKKNGLVDALVRYFNRTSAADSETLDENDRKGRTWLPGAMMFPAVVSQPETED